MEYFKIHLSRKLFLLSTASPLSPLSKCTRGVVDSIKNGEIHLIINTAIGRMSAHDDSYIRKAAIKYKIPYITTATAVKGIAVFREGHGRAKSLQSYHADIH